MTVDLSFRSTSSPSVNEIGGSLVKESLDDIRGSNETQGWGQIERSGSLRLDNFD